MIYLDNSATTKVLPEVVEAMIPWFGEGYGNPSSIYEFSDPVKEAVWKARSTVAAAINADPEEIFFTSGGTEADNWAIKGFCYHKNAKIVTTQIEHHAILNSCKSMNIHTTYLNVSKAGKVRMSDFEKRVKKGDLVSVMFANNEIGTIQPIEEIGKILRKKGATFHTDAVQAFGVLPIDVKAMNIDMLSASGHKLGAPKGIGFLYIRKGIEIKPFIDGGKQEFGMRGGTENVPYIIGLAKAVEIAEEKKKVLDKYDNTSYTMREISKYIPNVQYTGSILDRLPNHVSFCIGDVRAEELIMLMSAKGFCIGSGSACTALSGEMSHVLKAIGVSEYFAKGSIRVTTGSATQEEILLFVKELARSVKYLRDRG